jgi:putative hemolysin
LDQLLIDVVVIVILVMINGVFAMAEIAVVTARRARLRRLAEEGKESARTALDLAQEPNQFLSTIQIGITLIGVLAGAFGGATLAGIVGDAIGRIPLLRPYARAIGVGIVVIGTAYLSLVIGELVPKRLAMARPERIAMAVAAPMRTLSKVTAPLVWLLSVSTEGVLRLLRVQPSAEPSVTEEEIRVLIEEGTQIGILEEVEQDMIEGVLRLDDRRVSVVMTPRSRVVWLDITDSFEENRHKIAESKHGRFPVAMDDLDDVLGILLAKDLLALDACAAPPDLRELLRPALAVPETIPVLRVLELFKQERTHLAMVIDEYGSVVGMITSDDILDSIVGDIPSHEEPLAIQREDGSWLLDGTLHIDQLKQIFDLDELPGEEDGTYQTVGGFIVYEVGSIPVSGQHFEWDGIRFEVVDMDGPRVDKVLATQMAESSTPPARA